MKKILLILIVIFSSLNLQSASAATLSHSQMMDMYGEEYSNALFETVLEVQTKAMVHDEVNRSELTQYVDNSLGYWKSRFNAYNETDNVKDLFIEMGTGALTLSDIALDILSKIFGESDEPINESCSKMSVRTSSTETSYIVPSTCGYGVYYKVARNSYELVSSKFTVDKDNKLHVGNYNFGTVSISGDSIASINAQLSALGDGTTIYIYIGTEGKPVKDTSNNVTNNTFGDRNRTYINNPSSRPTTYISQLQPQLSCPDGIRTVQIDGAGGFLYENGVKANTDNCTVIWQKPIVQIDENGNITLINPDGTVTDPVKKPVTNPKDKIVKVEDKGEGCDGVLCFLGAVTSGIADLIGSILGLVKDLLEGLVSLFVPKNLDFLTEQINKAVAAFNKKVDMTGELKIALTGLFEGGGGNPLSEVSFSLPGSNQTLTLDTSIIETAVPTLRRIISAIVSLYTILYVYRKITGRGGVMEK